MLHQISATVSLAYVGSPELYSAVRAGFVNQNTSLNKWCSLSGLNRQTVEKALKGERSGRNAVSLIECVVLAAYPDSRRVRH
jgi:hypothetical protein